MNNILEIDEENLTITVQAGVITLDIIKAVEEKGLFYPPDLKLDENFYNRR